MRTLYRSFSVSDHGVAEYIRNTRLHRAKRELAMAGSAANINAVARRWGFCDKSYFAKLFRQQFGCLPSDYIRGV
jgi:AraC-like DNA-binding protein